jgi:pimeloyl-ACP methyl ester carboxylesterase
MEQVTSLDGTSITFHRSGAGSPLILVPGAGAANPVAWTAVIPTLEEHFSVYAVDRRGHGESSDSPDYAIEREFEDIAVVVDSIGEPVNLLGHSYGGICALEAALLTSHIRKLVLYEPLSLPQPGLAVYPQGFIDQLQLLIDAGDREKALVMFYRVIAGLSPQEIEMFKSNQEWTTRLAFAHTLPRELRADRGYRFKAHRFSNLQIPTLLLEGGSSKVFAKKGNAAVAAALPNSRVMIMPGQQHFAMYTAPEIFLREVTQFLAE